MFVNPIPHAAVFPAHAGMSLMWVMVLGSMVRFPRACGDEPRNWELKRELGQFSPRMRG